MRVERIFLGTTNPAKVQEWTGLLSEKVEVAGINDLGDFDSPDERGDSFLENAREKARYYAKLTNEFILSEDGGYEVDALGGAPGVKSRRILPGDKDGTDDELIDYVLEKVRGFPEEKRGVSLTCAAALSSPEGEILFEGKVSLRGIISEKRGPVVIEGYPFRTIHFLPELSKTYAELTEEEHKEYNHKKKLATRLLEFLIKYEQK
jgi:XTP/dITP diphosphohydrolase